MKRLLIALSMISATAYAATAQAESPKAPQYDPNRFSEFVYDALGATPSIQLGKSKGKAETAQRADAKSQSQSGAELQSAARAVSVLESTSVARRDLANRE